MLLEHLFPLLAFAAITTITPGGATTLATASGVRFGFRRSLPLIAGMVVGLATMAAAAALGLASLLLAATALQLGMKAAGTGYLLWLAWKIGSAGPPNLAADLTAPTSLVGGLTLVCLNPKAWTMVLAASASFSSLASAPWQLAGLLAGSLGLCGAIALVLWCLAGRMLAGWLRTERQWRTVNAILGVLLVSSVFPIWME